MGPQSKKFCVIWPGYCSDTVSANQFRLEDGNEISFTRSPVTNKERCYAEYEKKTTILLVGH